MSDTYYLSRDNGLTWTPIAYKQIFDSMSNNWRFVCDRVWANKIVATSIGLVKCEVTEERSK